MWFVGSEKPCIYSVPNRKQSYDSENNKFYDLNEEEIIYALPLIPEKYFRKKEIPTITFDALTSMVNSLEQELKELFGGEHS